MTVPEIHPWINSLTHCQRILWAALAHRAPNGTPGTADDMQPCPLVSVNLRQLGTTAGVAAAGSMDLEAIEESGR